MQYNPNNYCFLAMSNEGYVLAHNVAGDIISSVQDDDRVLGYMNDFMEICKFFTEVIELDVKQPYNIGDKIVYKNCIYYVLEVAEEELENSDNNRYTILVGKC
jgi:hypothetical protein